MTFPCLPLKKTEGHLISVFLIQTENMHCVFQYLDQIDIEQVFLFYHQCYNNCLLLVYTYTDFFNPNNLYIMYI